MKVTCNWLKEYTDFQLRSDELVDTLTMLGLEVDEAVEQAHAFSGVVVAEVIAKDVHPNADRLSLCTVNDGTDMLSVICGAPNVASGQKVPLARVGALLPAGISVKKTRIRGVESFGMICSEAELGLSSRSEGIMVLAETAEIGQDLQSVLGPPDFLIDIDVTPNRPDCFGAIGVAREIAAVSGGNLKLPKSQLHASGDRIDDRIQVKIHAPDKCPRYATRFIDNVRVGPSPYWLARRLEQIGVRSINNVVDVTNFIMMETGQPLHAFDYDLLSKSEINVQVAEAGSEFTTLDDKVHALHGEVLLICDGEKPIALGGVMGGLNSEVSAGTTRVLLESAYFDPVNIRRTSKKLGISTESSKRFERGVDPNGVLFALDRAAQLISELADGTIAKGTIDVYPVPIKPVTVCLRPERVELLLGVKISTDRMKEILTKLGFSVSLNDDLSVEVPTFRPDVTREADLIEEIGRVFGYDNIPSDPIAVIDQSSKIDPVESFAKNVRSTLVSFGFSETTTYNLMAKKPAGLFSSPEGLIKLLNPLSEELSILRPSLLPTLLNCIRWNINRKNVDLKFFEIGTAFIKKDGKFCENKRISAVMTGRSFPDSWQVKSSPLTIFDTKGFTDHLLKYLGVAEVKYSLAELPTATYARRITWGERVLGHFGQINSEILNSFKIEHEVFFFDLDFETTQQIAQTSKKFSAIPKFPFVLRDLAVLVRDDVAASDLVRSVTKAGGELLKNTSVFDVYAGDKVAPGFKSIALGLTFYSLERTLQESEIDSRIEAILAAISVEVGAELRLT